MIRALGTTPILQTDAQLMVAFRTEGTREMAFTGIIRNHQEKLYWHIRRLVLDHDDADDVLQQTFIKAWKGLENFRGDAQLSTWLYRVATNEALSFLDKEKRRAALSLSSHEDYLAGKLESQEGFDGKKLEWQLQQAIQALPEKQRTVFCLRYYDELPYEQMSTVLDTSVGALKASYHHAAKKIEAAIRAF